MAFYVVIIVCVCLVAFFLPMILEARARCLNPTPKMNNEDKRFMHINKIKTRDMFDCIKR